MTKHPTSAWVIQQLREAFPYDSASGYLIFDRGTQFNGEVIDTVKSFGIQPKRTSYRSPRQNGVAERFVGNCRRDLLDHLILLNERHLKRLMNDYVRYYHDDWTHLALAKGTPTCREAANDLGAGSKFIAMPRLGGLHYRYDLAACGRIVHGDSAIHDSPRLHCALRSPNASFPVENHFQNHRFIRGAGPFSTRMEFWRGTGSCREPIQITVLFLDSPISCGTLCTLWFQHPISI